MSATPDIQTLAQTLAWNKGLLPGIVQDAFSGRVLMQGWINETALEKTIDSGLVTFWSRSRDCLWTKGKTSGNYLKLVSIHTDCDRDSLLILAEPKGPTCHLNTTSCFDQSEAPPLPELAFLSQLEETINSRIEQGAASSYTAQLYAKETHRIAQKVAEEGAETAIAAAIEDDNGLVNESADLIYHLLVLLKKRGKNLQNVVETLKNRAESNK